MSNHQSDVVIVGGGPAGSAAAIHLARQGRQVTLLDKATFPREKCCGDGLTTGALRHLEDLGLDPTTLPSCEVITTLDVRSPSGKITSLPFREDGIFACVVKRSELDEGLLTLAKESGVNVLEATKASNVEAAHDASHLVVETDKGATFAAPYVFAADGAHSTLRQLQNKQEPQEEKNENNQLKWFAYRTYATNVSGEASRRLWVDFSKDLLPGYLWSFPLSDNTANIGICFYKAPHEKGAALSAKWQQTLLDPFLASILGPNAVIANPVKAWPIPSRVQSTAASAFDGRLLFLGDAVQSGDPMTGEGVGQAFTTSVAASNVVIAHPDEPEIAAAAYAEQLSSGLARDHALAGFFSSLLTRPALANAMVQLCGVHPRIARNAARWLYEDYPRIDLLHLNKWSQIRQRQPGPFATSN